ncbi:MAG: outer membrane beta-barrel protein [Gammaproteobacteria bacterium]
MRAGSKQRWRIIAVAIALAMLSAPAPRALAEMVSDRSTPELRIPADPSDFPDEAVGIRTGSFQWFPAARTALAYDSNLFATHGSRTAEGLSVTEATMTVANTSSTLNVQGAGFVRARRFAKTGDQDTTEGGAALQLSTPDGLSNELTARLLANRRFESRTDIETPDIRAVSLYDEVRSELDYRHTFNRFAVQPSLVAGRLDYSQASQQYRDRNYYRGELRTSYALTTDLALIATGSYGRDEYRTASPLVASADTGAALVGMRTEVPEVLELELQAGYFRRHFDDNAGEISGASVRGTLTMYPTRLMTLRATLLREDEPTGIPGALAKVRTEASLEIQHEYSRNLKLFARGRRVVDDFEVVQRTDKAFQAEAGADYQLTTHWRVGLEYDYANRNSADLGETFGRHLVSLTLIGRL